MSMFRARFGVWMMMLGYFIMPRQCRAYIDHVMNLGEAAMRAPKPEPVQYHHFIPIENCGQTSFRLH